MIIVRPCYYYYMNFTAGDITGKKKKKVHLAGVQRYADRLSPVSGAAGKINK